MQIFMAIFTAWNPITVIIASLARAVTVRPWQTLFKQTQIYKLYENLTHLQKRLLLKLCEFVAPWAPPSALYAPPTKSLQIPSPEDDWQSRRLSPPTLERFWRSLAPVVVKVSFFILRLRSVVVIVVGSVRMLLPVTLMFPLFPLYYYRVVIICLKYADLGKLKSAPDSSSRRREIVSYLT